MEKLAINGGHPVRSTMLNYARQLIDDDDIDAVVDILKGDWLTTGPTISAFESAVADYTGAKYAVAVNTGTAALHGAVHAAGIKQGDEVIVPPLTFVASSNCVLYAGAKPVFADIDAKTLNIDPKDIENKITTRTKAIVAVDLCGQPCDHDEIRKIAEKNHLTVIEDASHSLGGTYYGRKVGTLQEMTTLSFHPVKLITTGEGGMVLLDDEGKAEKIRSFRHHGIDLDYHKRKQANLWQYDIVDLGYNYRITDFCCALGISQLKKLDGWLARRRFIAKQYDKAFADLTEIETPYIDTRCVSAWHIYVIKLKLNRLNVGREVIYKALHAENIGVNVHYIPIPWLGLYQKLGYSKGSCPVAEQEYERLLTLPLYPAMCRQDVQDVIDGIHKVINFYKK